jgi:hypothetical protein
MMFSARSLLTAALAGSVLTAAALTAPVTATAAPKAPDCKAFDDPVYEKVKPTNDASLVTTSSTEAAQASEYGFTKDGGTVFRASTKAAPGLVPVHRLFRKKGQDFIASASPGEWKSAVAKHGYSDQGVRFFVSPVAADCLVPVYRYIKKNKHRLAVSASSRAALTKAGWSSEGISFYAAPSAGKPTPTPTPTKPAPTTGDTKFSFAVYPDTQQEVGKDTRFINRANWLVKNRSSLDVRFVTHSGDVVNFDTPAHDQYEVASKAMVPLEKAGIPYSLAIGNHDTQATGVGGSARDPKNTRKLQRDTSTFNAYFNAGRYGGVSGAFEKNKVDNVYSLYEAGDVKWMVLVLELWPRQSVVDWAKKEVAAHPDHNVVVVTHEYLTGGGGIAQSAQYGDTSPQKLHDQLISQYSNIRMVFSGHVGLAGNRVDTGVHGNKIYSFLTTMHSGRSNPIRLVEIDTKANSINTRIYAPWDDVTYSKYTKSITGVNWVR